MGPTFASKASGNIGIVPYCDPFSRNGVEPEMRDTKDKPYQALEVVGSIPISSIKNHEQRTAGTLARVNEGWTRDMLSISRG
jgi:hypothetical protein